MSLLFPQNLMGYFVVGLYMTGRKSTTFHPCLDPLSFAATEPGTSESADGTSKMAMQLKPFLTTRWRCMGSDTI